MGLGLDTAAALKRAALNEFVGGMRELVVELSDAEEGTPEAHLRDSLGAALADYDAKTREVDDATRLEDAARWPASVVVHWPTGPHPACVQHAEQLVGLAAFTGAHVACTPLTRPEACVNCKTEAEEGT